jgi:phage terminase large subunit-like protein
LRKHVCYGGLDLASVRDLAAFVLLFPEDDKYKVLPFFWIPEETARIRSEKDRVPYDQWIKEGLIKATEGDVIDYDVIRRDINELADVYGIREIAFDPWNSSQIVIQLASDNFTMANPAGISKLKCRHQGARKLVRGGELVRMPSTSRIRRIVR